MNLISKSVARWKTKLSRTYNYEVFTYLSIRWRFATPQWARFTDRVALPGSIDAMSAEQQGRKSGLHNALFYGISLMLSLIIIVVSTAVFLVFIYLEGSVPESFFLLYLGVLATNLAVSVVSTRQLIALIPALSLLNKTSEVEYPPGKKSGTAIYSPAPIAYNDERYFTEAEIEIIELLRKNNNRLLQSRLVSSVGASKATVSRVISSLESKGVIVKLRKGVTNEIILSETNFK